MVVTLQKVVECGMQSENQARSGSSKVGHGARRTEIGARSWNTEL